MNHMAYHLLTYSLIFLPVVIALYQLCPARFRFVVLLAADYTFFCMISGKLLVWLLLATLVTYGTGRWLAAEKPYILSTVDAGDGLQNNSRNPETARRQKPQNSCLQNVSKRRETIYE